MQAVKATELVKGDVLLLPMGRTATIADDPKTGTKYVTYRTEYGKARIGRYDTDIPIEDRRAQPPTYACATEWHGGEMVSADYFLTELNDDRSTKVLGASFAACEEHLRRAVHYMTERTDNVLLRPVEGGRRRA